MVGLTQSVIRGQSTAQGTILSERNQRFWSLCFKGPLWQMWQSKNVNPRGLALFQPKDPEAAYLPRATTSVQDNSLKYNSYHRV